MDDDERRIRQSMAAMRQSIYGTEEVEFVDLFQYDMDEEDHKEIISVMEGSLNRIPTSFRTDVINRFLLDHPEINVDVEQVVHDEKDVAEISDYAMESVKRSRWTLFHKEFQKQQQEMRGRAFTIVNPEEFWLSVKEKCGAHNNSLRLYAIQKLGNDINNSLYTIYKLNTCNLKEIKISDYEHFNIFSWTEDEFLARRAMKGIAWVDIFQKSLTVECLDAFKLRNDIIELARLIKLILMSFYVDNDYLAADSLTTIYDAFTLLDMQNRIMEELQESIDFFVEKIDEITTISNKRKSQNRDVIKNFLELELMASWVKHPVENRYQMKYLKHKVEDWQHWFDVKEKKLEEQLTKAKTKYQNEKTCFQYTMQCMYNTIENYKVRMEKMSQDYDKRFNEMQEKNTFLKLSLDKMKIRREFMEAESLYMRQRIREILDSQATQSLLRRSKKSSSRLTLSGKQKKR